MNLKDKKLCIIGGGNLGVALARGIANKQLIKPGDITITRRKIEQLELLRNEGFSVTDDNPSAVEKSEIIIIAVQPKQLSGVFDQVRETVRPSHMIISTLAGTPIEFIQEHLKKEATILRVIALWLPGVIPLYCCRNCSPI